MVTVEVAVGVEVAVAVGVGVQGIYMPASNVRSVSPLFIDTL